MLARSCERDDNVIFHMSVIRLCDPSRGRVCPSSSPHESRRMKGNRVAVTREHFPEKRDERKSGVHTQRR